MIKPRRDPRQSDGTIAGQAKDTELVQYATEIKVRAERRCGEMLRDTAASGERAPRGKPAKTSNDTTLSDMGLTRDESSRYQKLAAMPDEHFETAVATAKATAGEVTTAHMLREARRARPIAKRTRNDGSSRLRVPPLHVAREVADRSACVKGARMSSKTRAAAAARVLLIRLASAAIAASMLLGGCSRASKVVVIDEWWNADYAKSACRAAKEPELCASALVADVREYEDAIMTELASSAECKGVRVVRFDGPAGTSADTKEAMLGQFWSLTLDITERAPSQHWGLVQTGSANVFGGAATPAQIASKVCAIVNGRGASS
jgi:hypothetical protein